MVCSDIGYSLTYWRRDLAVESEHAIESAIVDGGAQFAHGNVRRQLADAPPTVFFHGVGIGIVMYVCATVSPPTGRSRAFNLQLRMPVLVSRYVSFITQMIDALLEANSKVVESGHVSRTPSQNDDHTEAILPPITPCSAVYLVEQPHITMQLDEDAVVRQIPAAYFADGVTRMLHNHGHAPRCVSCPNNLEHSQSSSSGSLPEPNEGAVFIGISRRSKPSHVGCLPPT